MRGRDGRRWRARASCVPAVPAVLKSLHTDAVRQAGSRPVIASTRCRRTGAGRRLLILLLVLLALPALAAEVPLRGAWLPGAPERTAQNLPAETPDSAWRAFDPSELNAFARVPDGAWVRLAPADGHWPAVPAVLSMRSPPLGEFVLYAPDGTPLARNALHDGDPRQLHGHGRVAFELPVGLPDGSAVVLGFEPYPSLSGPVTFSLQPALEFLREDARWLAFATICLALMTGMAMMALCFGVLMRDLAYFLYASYVIGYVVIQLVQTGYAMQPLELAWIGAAPRPWGMAATCVSVVSVALFLDRFADLRAYSPRGRRAVFVFAAAIVLNGVLAAVPLEPLQAVPRGAINVLLLLGGPMLLLIAVVAVSKGSRYAGYFLVGWTPLLAFTALGSAQALGALRHATWLADAALAAAAFETVVLSVGLADRTLALRRERDRARRLADIDSLTSVLNRRAWSERAQELLLAARRGGTPLSLLFLDLDGFKTLNDQRGHDAGDRALLALADLMRRELRARDVIGRYGGEEFVVALPHCTSQRALATAEALRAAVEGAAIPLGEGHGIVTVCVGVAGLEDGDDLPSLLARADRAMYAAKENGRNRVELAA